MVDAYELRSNLGIHLNTADLKKFSEVLEDGRVPLNELKDFNGLNIFHDVAECRHKDKLSLQFLQVLVLAFKRQFGVDAGFYVEQMVNVAGGKEKLTPLRVALKTNKKVKNTQELFKALISLGANPFEKSENSQNLAFLASKIGCDYILAYLYKEVGLNCGESDAFNSTPLHIAASENNTSIGLMLIAWYPDLNKQDNNGNTALHLSIKSNNYKLVRNLLLRNADPKIKNFEGCSPEDLVEKSKNFEIWPLFVNIIQNSSFLQKINPFHSSIKNTKHNYIKQVLFIVFFCLRFSIVIIYLPRVYNYISYTSVGLLIMTGILFSLISCKDPGFVGKPFGNNILTLLETYRSDFICFYCECRKNPKTRHCHICKKCVYVRIIKEFHHHCHWIHNCIGNKNYFWFILWLVFSTLDYAAQAFEGVCDYLGIFIVATSKNFFNGTWHFEYFGLVVAGVNAVVGVFVAKLLLAEVWDSCRNKNRRKVGNFSEFKRNLNVSEMSDTDSMLMRSSDEWKVRSHFIN